MSVITAAFGIATMRIVPVRRLMCAYCHDGIIKLIEEYAEKRRAERAKR